MGREFERFEAAATEGGLPALRRLLADEPGLLEERDAEGHSLLGLACLAATGNLALPPEPGTREQQEVVDLLLAAGADPSAANLEGWAPLHSAAMTGHTDLIDRLLAAGADREGWLLGAEGGSPLALGLFYAKAERMGGLASPAVPDSLRTAASLDRPLGRFVVGGALTAEAATGTDFYRPLPAFPLWERTGSRQELLNEALTWAARNGALGAMAALVELGADVDANPYRGTALLWAIYSDRVEAARWLLDQGADPDLRHDFGGSEHGQQAVAMHLAAQYGALRCLRLLLQRGADPTLRDGGFRATPLEWAEHAGSAEAAALLRAFC